jgi:crossover junction endodeoxyribonuclease RusA
MNPEPKTLTLHLPYPPSVGNCWGRTAGGRSYLKPEGQAFRAEVLAEVIELDPDQFDGPVRVVVRVTFPDWKPRDIDNLSKALLDALTLAGVWQDDLQVRSTTWDAVGVDPEGNGWIDVHIEELRRSHWWWLTLAAAKKIGSTFWAKVFKGAA